MLRERGVVGKFVEFYGPGLATLPLADRATIGNMSPEFGSTCAIFPIDAETLRYLEFSGRPKELIDLVEAYTKEQGLWHDEHSRGADVLRHDRARPRRRRAVAGRPEAPAGPRAAAPTRRPAFRIALGDYVTDADGQAEGPEPGVPPQGSEDSTEEDEGSSLSFPASDPPSSTEPVNGDGARDRNGEPHGPRRGRRRGRRARGHRRRRDDGRRHRDRPRPRPRRHRRDHELHEHLEPVGHARRRPAGPQRGRARAEEQAVGEDLAGAGLEGRHGVPRARRADDALEALGFHLVGYGCTTCIGNSGPAARGDLRRRQRARPRGRLGPVGQPQLRGAHQPRREDELPRLAAARRRLRAGRDDGHRPRQRPARAPTPTARRSTCATSGRPSARSPRRSSTRCSRTCSAPPTARSSRATSAGTRWRCPTGDRFAWAEDSTYVRQPPYFEGMPAEPEPVTDIEGARVLAKLGDSVTTDHISPAGAIKKDGPAGAYLHRARRRAQGLQLLRLAARQPRGDDARHVREHPPAQPAGAGHRGRRHASRDGEEMSIYDAAMQYIAEGTPLVVLAGKEYGSGSSRDWAAKGTNLLGVRAVHRRELRAHPPLQPRRHGRAAAAVPRRRDRRVARPHRRGGVLDHRPGRAR